MQTPAAVPPVALARCPDYAPANVNTALSHILEAITYQPAYGSTVLLKPNLLAPSSDGLCCTHPEVITSACAFIKDHGAIPVVGDSPAFGSAVRVAKNIGLDVRLQQMNIPIITLEHPRIIHLQCGLKAGISRHALEADSILNLPKLKAHSQFRVTGGVKNLFGCVSGVRKALAHSKHGDRQNAFRSMLVEIQDVLPPVTALLDGIVGMDHKGPSGGDPFPLGILGASQSTVALDTAAYTIIGATPDRLPLWQELRHRGNPAAFAENLHFPLLAANAVDGTTFRFPEELKAESFHPVRLLRSAIKRFVMRYITQ